MSRWRPGIRDLRAVWWTHRALGTVRSQLARGQTRDLTVTPPPAAARGGRGVCTLLRCRQATCLESALVRQRWLAAHGVGCDVVIGVTPPSEGFTAHAWLERSHRTVAPGIRPWRELMRFPAADVALSRAADDASAQPKRPTRGLSGDA